MPAPSSVESDYCSPIEQKCREICGSSGGGAGEYSWSVLNGEGTYSCRCCSSNAVTPIDPEQTSDLSQLPRWAWAIIATMVVIPFVAGFILDCKAPPGPKYKKPADDFIGSQLQSFTGLLVVDASSVWRLTPIDKFVYDSHPIVGIWKGDHQKWSKQSRLFNFIFGFIFSISLAVAFGTVLISGSFSCNKSYCCSAGAGSSSCSESSITNANSDGGSVSTPSMADLTWLGAVLTAVSLISSSGSAKLLQAAAKYNGQVKLVAKWSLLVFGLVFLALSIVIEQRTSSSDVDSSTKIQSVVQVSVSTAFTTYFVWPLISALVKGTIVSNILAPHAGNTAVKEGQDAMEKMGA